MSMQTISYAGYFINVDYGLGRLTLDEIIHNGMALAQNFYNFGWTENAIAGILGNIHAESGMNPGSMENPKIWTDAMPSNAEVLETTYSRGIGIVQWTPGRVNLVQWADDHNLVWYNGLAQVLRLKYECDNHLEMGWLWDIYTVSTNTPEECAEFFLVHYERPTPEEQEQSLPARQRYAGDWYDRIHGKLMTTAQRLIFTQNNRKRKELKRKCLRI